MDVITIIFWGGIIAGAISLIGAAINKIKGVFKNDKGRIF